MKINLLFAATACFIVFIIGQSVVLSKEGSGTSRKSKARASIDAAKTKRADAVEAAKAKRQTSQESARERLSERANQRAETRQGNQAKRIEHGINKGYLTQEEAAKLNTQQKNIESLQQSFSSDGKLTGNEALQLRNALNEASRCIFAEKHDADGNTMPVFRLGSNVTMKNDVAQVLGSENLSKQEARVYLNDFHRMMEITKTLSTGNISEAERNTLQNEYNNLLNKYFETK